MDSPLVLFRERIQSTAPGSRLMVDRTRSSKVDSGSGFLGGPDQTVAAVRSDIVLIQLTSNICNYQFAKKVRQWK